MRILICGCVDTDIRVRIRGYGYAYADTRIRGYAFTDTRIRRCGYGDASTRTRKQICGIRICEYGHANMVLHIYIYIYVQYYTKLYPGRPRRPPSLPRRPPGPEVQGSLGDVSPGVVMILHSCLHYCLHYCFFISGPPSHFQAGFCS